MNISSKALKRFKIFTEIGGTSGVVCYLIDKELTNALLIAIIFGVLAICFEYYSNKLK